jgi:biotin carboxylase
MRVLIVGTNRPCHHRLHEHGHELVLFMPHAKAIPEDLSGPYQHLVALGEAASDAAWVAMARALHAESPFGAVVSYNDRMQALAHAIGAQLGIACTLDMAVVNAVADKSVMRQILDQHAIPSCKHVLARGTAALRDAIGIVGLPCIVKPVDGEASAGVVRLDTRDQLDAALAWIGAAQIERGVIVEEFLVGDEYSVEAISGQDRHHIIAVTKKFKNAETFVEIGHLVPAPIEAGEREAIEAYVTRILAAFNFRNCPSHTELILTAQGPRIIETHTRVGGDRILDLVRHSTGVDMYDLVAQQSVGVDIGPLLPAPVVHQQSAAVWYADPGALATQELSGVLGVDDAKKLPYVKSVEILRKPGTRGAAVRSSFERSGLAVAVGESPAEALTRARAAIDALEFVYSWKPKEAVGTV